MATYHSSGAQFSSRVNGANGQKNGAKIRAAHLLVKHRNSRRRTSWREKEITRSEADADRMIRNYLKRIKSGEISLGDLAVRESDCSSARKRGDLYVIRDFNLCVTATANSVLVDILVKVICRKNLN